MDVKVLESATQVQVLLQRGHANVADLYRSLGVAALAKVFAKVRAFARDFSDENISQNARFSVPRRT